MNWLAKAPVVSVLIVAAMLAAPFILRGENGATATRFGQARDQARDFYVHNPRLAVDALGELILDPVWLEEARAAANASSSSADVELPMRMLARSQAKLDGMVETAHAARMKADPAWRLGVLDAQTPPLNYLAHAFVHEAIAGLILCVVVLILVGVPLEQSWGSGIFAGFCVVAIPLTAQGYRFLDASSGIPWSGSAGLSGALLGAYFIRGLGGHFVLPGWILLPIWLGVEAVVVRSFWIDDLGSVPWASFCAAVGFGCLVAGALQLVGVESALESLAASSRVKNGPNPIVARTARLRSDGDPYQAFDLIEAAWRDDPGDRDVAEAFFSIAVEVGQPAAAAEAILPSLHESVRKGNMSRALEYWIPVATAKAEVKLEATAAVRLGEALLDKGHPEQAIFTLRSALDSGVSSAHALRIVRVARDLDEGLAREAAAIALADRTLDPIRRAELQKISSPGEGSERPAVAPNAQKKPLGAGSGRLDSALARRVEAEHQAIETTSFPFDADTESDDLSSAPLGETVVERSRTTNTAHETQLVAQNLDPSALSPESFEESATDGAPGDTKFLDSESGDVLSHWSDRQLGGETIADLDGDLPAEDQLLCEEDLELFDESLDLSETDAVRDARDAETDTDLTPMMEASEDLTSPFAGSSPADELTVFAPSPSPVSDAGAASLGRSGMVTVGDQPTKIFSSRAAEFATPTPITPPASTPDPRPSAASTPTLEPTRSAAPIPAPDETVIGVEAVSARKPVADPAETVIAPSSLDVASTREDFAIGVDTPSAPERALRPLKAIDAVPVALQSESIEIDVAGRGKSKLPIARIEAIVVAGISGLAVRPVLLVDFALNWTEDPSKPLKVIRFRSDRFDPRNFEPGEANPLDALTAWVRRLQIRSEATCLPSRAILQGRFARYGSVEEYESEVLTAMRAV